MVYFKKLDEKDWLNFKEIVRESFYREDIQEEGFLKLIGDEGLIGIFKEDILIGYLRLMTHKNYGHLGQIAVTKIERGKGYGNKLMEQALGFFRTKGMKRVGLYVETKNQIAISLYEKYGFKRQFESWHYWIEEEFYKKIEETSEKFKKSDLKILTSTDYNTIVEVFPEINREELEAHLNKIQNPGLTGGESIPLGLFVNNKLQIYGRLNPEFPGCRPFLVTDPKYIDDFFSGTIKFMKKNYIRLTFDRNSKLAEFFQERGYKLWHHMFFMEKKEIKE